MSDKKQIGKILLRQRALSPAQLDRALADQKGGRLASRLAADGTISDIAALKALRGEIATAPKAVGAGPPMAS